MAPHGARLLLLLVVAAAGLLEGRDAGVPVTLALYGELYDISSIGTWHPGGAQILRQAGNLQLPDATQLFESQHSMRDPDEMKAHLLPYRLNGTRAKQLYTFRPDGFYRTVKKRVADHIRPPGMEAPFRRAAPKGGFWLLGKFAFWMTCAAGLLVASVRAERLLVGGLLAFLLGFTLFMVCCFQVRCMRVCARGMNVCVRVRMRKCARVSLPDGGLPRSSLASTLDSSLASTLIPLSFHSPPRLP